MPGGGGRAAGRPGGLTLSGGQTDRKQHVRPAVWASAAERHGLGAWKRVYFSQSRRLGVPGPGRFGAQEGRSSGSQRPPSASSGGGQASSGAGSLS